MMLAGESHLEQAVHIVITDLHRYSTSSLSPLLFLRRTSISPHNLRLTILTTSSSTSHPRQKNRAIKLLQPRRKLPKQRAMESGMQDKRSTRSLGRCNWRGRQDRMI